MATEAKAEQIARQVRADIEAGVLRDGQALPSTREMAREWQTSPGTVAAALRLLAEQGLVRTRDRSGSYVHAPGQAARAGRPPAPRVMLVGGYAGSGKTELGRILARITGWPMLDKDTITRPVVEAALEMLGQSPDDRESEVYLTRVRPAEYAALDAAMMENLECGNSAIVTAPFLRELSSQAWADRVTAACRALGAEVTIVWIRCDAASMRTYLRRRGALRDAWKLSHWEEYLAGVSADFTPAVPHRVIDNSEGARPLQEQAAALLAHAGVRVPAGG